VLLAEIRALEADILCLVELDCFEEFRDAIVRSAETSERLQRDRERALGERTGLDDRTFRKFRMDLIWLYAIFSQYDTDGSGKLDQVEVMRALKEFGVKPKRFEDRMRMQTVIRQADLDRDGKHDFREFLGIVDLVREDDLNAKTEFHKLMFRKYDKNGDGSLSVREISLLLDSMNLTPRNRNEQEELATLINTADEDGSDRIEFNEFQVFCQRVEERLNRLRFEDELQQALAMEFTAAELRDMRWVFDSLDKDMSGNLDAAELCECFSLMGQNVKRDEFSVFFKDLDTDGDGELDFKEFLEFMRIMRDKESLFDDTKPFKKRPRQLDTHVLRRVLENLRMAKSYITVLNHEELVEIFCSYFNISPTSSLQEKLGVHSTQDLYELSARWDSQLKKSATD